MVAAAWPALNALADDDTTNAAPAVGAPPTAASLVEQATHDAEDGRLDQAIREASSALELDPKNLSALELRGSIYVEAKLWDHAERDYTTLNQISPDPAYQYRLAQIKFLQKDFSNARPLFAALQNDSRLGDLAKYKVFMCDLLGTHEAFAGRDLATLDRTGQQPSFYYGQAAWALYHDQRAEANRLFAQAAGRFSTTICGLYLEAILVVQPFQPAVVSFTTKDGRKFIQSHVGLEGAGLRASTREGWTTVPLDQLPDDLSPFPPDMREAITRRRTAASAVVAETSMLTFTTKSGKSYNQVRWMLEDSGIDVLTTAGWTSVPFDDLPADHSSFPPDLQKAIAEMSKETTVPANSFSVVSFATRQGKRYDNVRASLDDEGVKALTPNGWTTIPFADLPADLSAFPPGWQPQIHAGQQAHDDHTSVTVVSFTTQGGTAYSDVCASLDTDGVRILTPNGWTAVPFTDLPADLSAFPSDWRGQIQAGRKAHADDDSGMEIVSFTTRHGKSYDRVRTALDDEGLRVLGPDGWVVVTYDQVPDDLSPFPEAWRATIAARQKEAAKPTTSARP
jgi:hypothetical protein